MSEWKKSEGSSNGELTPMWNFEADKVLTGVYTGKKTVGPNQSTMILIQNTEGETFGVWESKLLVDRMSPVTEGMEVKITYLGKVKTKGGVGSYKNYEVEYKE